MKLPKIILIVLFSISNPLLMAAEKASESRLDEVASKGRVVMPFNLEQTLHVFTKTENGGIQQVIVKKPFNPEQVSLIQTHLSKIYHDFSRADFSDPEKIHGKDMPGLRALQNAKIGDIELNYRDLEDGAEIVYATKKRALIKAIHLWFDAQLSDHARHSAMHRLHHKMHKNE